jgi:hypothetical protein
MRVNRTSGCLVLAALFSTIPALGSAQEAAAEITATDDDAKPPPEVYTPPTREEWQAAGLRLDEYQAAVAHEAPLELWLDMHKRRQNHQVVGWSCIGVALLTPIIELTVMYGGDTPFSGHPNMEIYILVSVAAFAVLTSGIAVLASTPGPQDVYDELKTAGNPMAFELGPTTLTPSPLGFQLTF